MPHIKVSAQFARWVAEMGQTLVEHYYGNTFDLDTGRYSPCNDEVPPIPIEDMIPRDQHDVVYWINNALMFIKTLARVFHLRADGYYALEDLLSEDIGEIEEINEI